MTTVLAYRFSAFGDVLLTIPVIMGTLRDNEDLRIVMITRRQFAPYFPCHDRLRVIGLDFERENSSILSLISVAKQVKESESIDYIADLHSVIRSYVLNAYFLLFRFTVQRLNKNRKARRRFIKGKNRAPLPMITDEYCRVFSKLGLRSSLVEHPLKQSELDLGIDLSSGKSLHQPRIGIAPLSKHVSKNWPLSYSQELIDILVERLSAKVFLFGSEEENKVLARLEGPDLSNISGKLSPDDEIKLISSLDLMVSMDSANMHLANLVGIPVVSIWGGTHPDVGFRPHSQVNENVIETTLDLQCRPCSVYGTNRCKLNQAPFLCLTSISPKTISKRIEDLLKN